MEDFKLIQSFEDACKAPHVNYDPEKCLPDVSGMPEELRQWTIDSVKRVVMAKAINPPGYKPDYTTSKIKYSAWFWINKAGSRFSGSAYGHGDTGASVGSRLVFESAERALHFASICTDVHVSVMLG